MILAQRSSRLPAIAFTGFELNAIPGKCPALALPAELGAD